MSKNIKRPGADELRQMAENTIDPVIERALRELASDMESEQLARRAPRQPRRRMVLA